MLLKATTAALTLLSSVCAAPSPAKRWSDPPLLPSPSGGINITNPIYVAGSDFDFESFNLVAQIEHIEYTLFGYGIERWSDADFVAQNLTADDRYV